MLQNTSSLKRGVIVKICLDWNLFTKALLSLSKGEGGEGSQLGGATDLWLVRNGWATLPSLPFIRRIGQHQAHLVLDHPMQVHHLRPVALGSDRNLSGTLCIAQSWGKREADINNRHCKDSIIWHGLFKRRWCDADVCFFLSGGGAREVGQSFALSKPWLEWRSFMKQESPQSGSFLVILVAPQISSKLESKPTHAKWLSKWAPLGTKRLPTSVFLTELLWLITNAFNNRGEISRGIRIKLLNQNEFTEVFAI